MTVDEAYAVCAGVARASSTSFYRGMRVLPAERRAAMFAVYALARRIDDVADGELSADAKAAALAAVRDALRADVPDRGDAVMVAVGDATVRYPIPLDAFDDLIAGAEMDLQRRTYETFDELVVYCRRVAGSIGRLCLGVFETRDRERAAGLADDLGVAFQLTNILRDVREDHAHGRVYLPQEDLRRFGCASAGDGFAGDMRELLLFEAERAHVWYRRGLELVPLLDRSSAASVRGMAAVYQRLLRRIERDPAAVLERRVSLPRWEKGLIAARSLVGVG